jgi:hypothetical protein
MRVETQQVWPVLVIGLGAMLIAAAWLLPTEALTHVLRSR